MANEAERQRWQRVQDAMTEEQRAHERNQNAESHRRQRRVVRGQDDNREGAAIVCMEEVDDNIPQNDVGRLGVRQQGGEAVSFKCQYCQALFFPGEKLSSSSWIKPLFGAKCCSNGAVDIPLIKEPPPDYRQLFIGQTGPAGSHFRKDIRHYNNKFAMSSLVATNRDKSMLGGRRGPMDFQVCGKPKRFVGACS